MQQLPCKTVWAKSERVKICPTPNKAQSPLSIVTLHYGHLLRVFQCVAHLPHSSRLENLTFLISCRKPSFEHPFRNILARGSRFLDIPATDCAYLFHNCQAYTDMQQTRIRCFQSHLSTKRRCLWAYLSHYKVMSLALECHHHPSVRQGIVPTECLLLLASKCSNDQVKFSNKMLSPFFIPFCATNSRLSSWRIAWRTGKQ